MGGQISTLPPTDLALIKEQEAESFNRFRKAWLNRHGVRAQLELVEGVKNVAQAIESFISSADKCATMAIRSKGSERAAWRKMEKKFRKHAEAILNAFEEAGSKNE